jgi:hypothetical protein
MNEKIKELKSHLEKVKDTCENENALTLDTPGCEDQEDLMDDVAENEATIELCEEFLEIIGVDNTPKVTASEMASSLRAMGYNVVLDKNNCNTEIDEIHIHADDDTGDIAWTLSYLPYDERNWAGIGNDGDDEWGWGILNQVDGYLVDEKNFQNDYMAAMERFVECIKGKE